MSDKPESRLKEWGGFLLIILLIAAVAVAYRHSGRRGPVAPPVEIQSSYASPREAAFTEIAHYEALWKAHPDHSPIALHLGNLYAGLGEHSKALNYYRAYLVLDTSAAAWEVNLDVAKTLFLMGERDSAATLLVELERLHPNHPGVLYNLGAVAANRGDAATARERWSAVIEGAPNSREANDARLGLSKLAGK